MPIEKKYPKEFYAARPLVLERAGNRCEDCPAENGGWHPKTGKLVRLQVHHLDGNKDNNALENLRAQCASCHGIYEAERKKRRKENAEKLPQSCRTEKRTGNRAKSGKFEGYKIVEKNKKLPHGETNRLAGDLPISKIDDFRVFIAQNKDKLKKAGLYRELAELVGGLSMPQLADIGKRTGNQANPAKEKTEGFVGIGDIAQLAGGFPMSVSKEAKKEERKRRKQEKAKREAERAAHAEKLDIEYEARREAAEADSEEPHAPRKQKEGNINWPYYKPFRRDGIRYRSSDGKAVNALTGEVLTHEQEYELIFGRPYVSQSPKTAEAA